MRCYKVYDKSSGEYRKIKLISGSYDSTFDKRSQAEKAASRLVKGSYEIHPFKLERVYE